MKKLLQILLFLGFIGCKSDKKNTISYYPSKIEFNSKYQHKKIDLDSTKLTYIEILQMIPEEDYRKYAPLFEISDGHKKRRILPFIRSFYMGKKKILTLNKDSVFADIDYQIEDLDFVMNDIFQKHGTSNYYNDDFPDIARVAINMKRNSSGKEIRELLLKVTRAFDKIETESQDSLFLKIYFNFPYDDYPPNTLNTK